MKHFITYSIAFHLILLASLKIYSQEIEIDSTFNSSFEIFPFEQINSLSGITMEGEVHLNSDTSLVRVILEDESGLQYMILESYPLICPGLYENFTSHCDETCALEDIRPSSIIIQVIDASLDLKSFHCTTDSKENAAEERYEAKRTRDAEKIETMNLLIRSYSMNWVAGDNDLVAAYYEQKRNLFGDGYNLRGYDYYSEGVFEFLGHSEYPKVDPDLVHFFDWRNRHGANDPSSPYWDGDILGTGWLTSVKNQGDYPNCYAFGAVGVSEALMNLYTNNHYDIDLSEQYLVACFDCSSSSKKALGYIKNPGCVTESCFAYNPEFESCPQKCQIPDTIFKISDTLKINETNFDSVRIALIKYGPLDFVYHPEGQSAAHAVTLTGFQFNANDSTINWIIKDSYGTGNQQGENGFKILPLPEISKVYAALGPVFINNDFPIDSCVDRDKDGYYFWGIGDKPKNCPVCSDTADCDDNDSLVGGYDENYNCRCNLVMDSIAHHISVDTNWSDTTYVNYEVIIDSGACLTISSYAAFAPQAYIVVSQGAELIIDGGYLTKACPNLWGGVEVWGSDTAQYFDEFFGKVVMTNNAVIEFAKTGIANHCTRCTSSQMQSGGIILADSSIFRNNETDVKLAPFENMWMDREYSYVGNFIKCQFITTNNFYPEYKPKVHLEMTDINGITISGCVFKNEGNMSLYPFADRGTGIYGMDAQFTIKAHCNNPTVMPCNDFDSCRFIGLEYGIKALNSSSIRTVSILDAVFNANLLAISLSGIDNASVLSNQIKCSKSTVGISPDRFRGGIFLEGCNGYHIENNYVVEILKDTLSAEDKEYYGIGIKNSGQDFNKIYNNRFEGLQVGIYALGENRSSRSGLCLTCNDMYSNTNDLVVDSIVNHPLEAMQGIYQYQGDPQDSVSVSAPAGNVFSNMSIPASNTDINNFNYFNNAEDIRYTHHQRQIDPLTYPLDSNYTKETIEVKGWAYLGYEKSTACPSGLGGGGNLKNHSSHKLTINDADIQMDSLKNKLNILVDGGNTEELNLNVMTSMPDDGLDIRQELLDNSPYLSDTVLKQAIYKENVLPNAMIRDILEANPQSAKSEEILNTLDSRYEPMPDYMMAQILQGKKYFGAKEILEVKIQSWSQIRSSAKADLMRDFLQDTNLVSPFDSVISFLENETDIDSRYDLALAQWNNSNYLGAWETLNFIPSQFTLSESQSINHENFIEYFGILQTLANNNLQASQLDSVSVSVLFDLKESGNPKIAALVRGLLVKGGFFNYIETVNFPDFTRSYKIPMEPHLVKIINIKEEKLWLFPNPVGDYVIAFYNLDPGYKSGKIQLVDLKGNLLRSYYIESGKDQVVIDLKAYPNGLYIISLNSLNQVIDSKKLIKGGK